MNHDNKPTYNFNWWKGFTMYRKSKMVEICLGLTIVMVGFGVMSFLILKAYAPNGFIH